VLDQQRHRTGDAAHIRQIQSASRAGTGALRYTW
jgi:hypothetical protein